MSTRKKKKKKKKKKDDKASKEGIKQKYSWEER